MDNPPKRILFVLNPVSGGRDKSSVLPSIELFCSSHSIVHAVFVTTGEDDLNGIKEEIQKFQPDTIVAIGGDGTVNQCASIVVNTPVRLGIIPLGSGNGLSKDLLIPQNDVEAALELLIDARTIKMDTLIANGHFFLHLCDIGFNARIVRLYSSSNRRGLLTYAYFMVREFFNYKSSSYKVWIDTKIAFRIKAFMITAANSNKFGSNIVINPEGKVDDGRFELVIIKPFPYKVLPKLIWQILWKRIHFSPYSKTFPAQQVSISHKRAKTLQVDGEIVGRFKEIEVKINPGSLEVIVPKGS